jgi:uncharacterized protein YkwD
VRTTKLKLAGSRNLALFVLAGFLLTLPNSIAQAGKSQTPPPPSQGSAAYLSIPSTSDELTQSLDPQFSGCGGGTIEAGNSQYEQRVVELVNAQRAAVGRPPLKRVDLIDLAARYHAADMWQDSYFEHDTYDRISGQLQKVCAWYSRVNTYYPSWTDLGENIALGYSSPESVMDGWMNSTGHKANILRDTFNEIGVGYYNGYWVQDFGRRSNIYPVIINNEAASTNSRDIVLYIYGSWTDMRIRNNADPWSNWQPFKNSTPWQLPNMAGNQVVSVEMRNSVISTSSSDSIFLDLNQQPELGDLPDAISFIYTTVSHEDLPVKFSIPLDNTGSQDELNWQASTNVNWLKVEPSSGTTPGMLNISINDLCPDTIGTYTGAIYLTVTSPPGVLDSPQSITVSLNVVNTPFWKNYLPMTKK